MEMSSGKILDEACNCFNEVYRDEVLYTSWIERLQNGLGAMGTVPASVGHTGITSGRSTRQE
jgi:hypothetical protein